MVAPAADTRMSHLAYVVAAVNLGGVIVLLVMYIVEIPRGAPYIFGSSSDLAGGIYNLLVVSLIMHFGRSAAISGTGRLGLWLAAAGHLHRRRTGAGGPGAGARPGDGGPDRRPHGGRGPKRTGTDRADPAARAASVLRWKFVVEVV